MSDEGKKTVVHVTLTGEAYRNVSLLTRVLGCTIQDLTKQAIESEVATLAKMPEFQAAFEKLEAVDKIQAEAKRNRARKG